MFYIMTFKYYIFICIYYWITLPFIISTPYIFNKNLKLWCNRWLFSTNHKDIGSLYIIFGFISGLIGTSLITIMKINNSYMRPICSGHVYNVIVTTHTLIMIFFTIIPILIGGYGNWFIPLMVGTPNIAFPRLNNLSFWLLPLAELMIVISACVEGGSGMGWTIYPPLSGIVSHSSACTDIVLFALHIAEFKKKALVPFACIYLSINPKLTFLIMCEILSKELFILGQ